MGDWSTLICVLLVISLLCSVVLIIMLTEHKNSTKQKLEELEKKLDNFLK